jgi:hypothetical protein
VHFNLNTLEVNGTLRAVGTSSEPITLNGDWRGRAAYFGSSDCNGILTFTAESNGWDAQSETGCIIENVNVISLSIYVHNASVKMNDNVFSGSHAWGGLSLEGGDSIISNNEITGGSVDVSDGSPVLVNNTIVGQAISIHGGSPNIIGNLLYSNTGYSQYLFPSMGPGITVSGGGNVRIADNIIANCPGFATSGDNVTFEHNLVLYCYYGCSLSSAVNVIVEYNTVAFNQYGIQSPPPSAKIIYNNLENNTQYNLSTRYSSNLDATYNWWGTTDASAITQTIVDYKNDYNLGNVTYIPFLDAPSPQAPLISSFVEPNPSPSPSQSPTSTPSLATTPTPTPPNMGPTSPPTRAPLLTPEQLEMVIVAAIAVAVIGAGLGLLIYLAKKK